MLPNLVDLFCISLWFILCGSPRASRNYISWYFLNLNAVHCSYTPLIPQIVWRGKPWLPFDQAQLTLNGSFRQMLISGKGSCTWWNNINREMSFGIFTFFTLSWPHYQPYPPIFFFFFFGHQKLSGEVHSPASRSQPTPLIYSSTHSSDHATPTRTPLTEHIYLQKFLISLFPKLCPPNITTNVKKMLWVTRAQKIVCLPPAVVLCAIAY